MGRLALEEDPRPPPEEAVSGSHDSADHGTGTGAAASLRGFVRALEHQLRTTEGAIPRPIRWAAAAAGSAVIGTAAVAILTGFWGAMQGPPRMQGEINIAVTEFNGKAPDGHNVHSDRANELSRHLAESLDSELKDLERELQFELLQPGSAGRLDGDTAEERSAAAQELAERVGADIVIYGVYSDSNGVLSPEFYIEPAFLEGAEELVGSSRLGSEISSRSGGPLVDIELRQRLQSRAKSLARFITGLTYLSGGNYAVAEARFHAAISDGDWPDDDGKEVMHLFIGTAAALDDRLDDAEAAYTEALRVNPDYARAYLGLAGVALLRGHQGCTPSTADRDELQESQELYRSALTALDRPPSSSVVAKAHLGIGRTAICLSQAGLENSWSEANVELESVVREFEAGDESVRELASEAHGELGLIHLPTVGDTDPAPEFRAAAQHYGAASDLAELPQSKAFFLGRLGWVMDELGDETAATDAYREAAAAADAAGDRESRDRYLRLAHELAAPS